MSIADTSEVVSPKPSEQAAENVLAVARAGHNAASAAPASNSHARRRITRITQA
jgi:hypothetical protein